MVEEATKRENTSWNLFLALKFWFLTYPNAIASSEINLLALRALICYQKETHPHNMVKVIFLVIWVENNTKYENVVFSCCSCATFALNILRPWIRHNHKSEIVIIVEKIRLSQSHASLFVRVFELTHTHTHTHSHSAHGSDYSSDRSQRN